MRYHRDRHQGKHGAVYAKVELGPHESVWVIEKLEKVVISRRLKAKTRGACSRYFIGRSEKKGILSLTPRIIHFSLGCRARILAEASAGSQADLRHKILRPVSKASRTARQQRWEGQCVPLHGTDEVKTF
jgi:hypothetical protein